MVFKKRLAWPTWVRLMIGAVGFLGFLLTALSMPQSIRDATENVPFLSQPVPWIVVAGVSVILFYVAVRTGYSLPAGTADSDKPITKAQTPTLDLPTPETKSPTLAEARQEGMLNTARAEADQLRRVLQVEVTKLQSEKQDRKKERAELKTKIQKLQDECQHEIKERDIARALHQETQARATEYLNQLRYCTSIRKYTLCDNEADRAYLHGELEKFKPLLMKAEEGVYGVARILHDALLDRKGTPECFLAHCVYDRVMEPVKSTAGLFEEQLSAGDDARGSLIAFYERYNHLREWIPRMEQFAKKELVAMTVYREWLAHDKNFFLKLTTLLEIHQLSGAKKDRRQLDLGQGYPVKMPEITP